MKKTVAIIMVILMMLSSVSSVLAVKAPVRGTLEDALNAEGMSFTYVNDELYPWTVVTNGDRSYAQSGNSEVDRTTSAITVTATFTEGQVIAFDYMVSCEEGWDGLDVYLDDEPVFEWYGNTNWETYYLALGESGEHVIRWEYYKDSSYSAGDDAACIDNVTLITPVEATEYVISQDTVLVGVDTSKSIIAEPIPSYNLLPEITVESDNEEIAVATFSDGVVEVTGVAIGNAVITLKAEGHSDKTINVTVAAADFVKGFVLFDSNEYYAKGWYNIDMTSGSAEELLASDETVFAAEYFDGEVYTFFRTEEGESTGVMCVLDAETYEVTRTLGNVDFIVNDLAYDYSSGTMYAIGNTEDSGVLLSMDMETGEFTILGYIEGVAQAIALACTTDGVLYCIDMSDNTLVTIDSVTLVSEVVDTIEGFEISYIQSMAYDHNTGRLFWAACDYAMEVGGIYEINMETAELSQNFFPVSEISGLYFEYEVEYAPATSVEVTPETAEVMVTRSTKLTATVLPAEANKRVTWTSSDTNIATVSASGVVTGIMAGTVTITATDRSGELSDTCVVTVIGELVVDLEENFNDELSQDWLLLDADGDAQGWYLREKDEEVGITTYEGTHMMTSASYINANEDHEGMVLNADNWMITPSFVAKRNMQASWYAQAQNGDYCDHYEVYVATLPTDKAAIDEYEKIELYSGAPTGEWGNVTVEIPESLIGETVVLMIRHFETDMYELNFDMLTISHIATEATHTVTFYDMDGTTVISSVEVEDGEDAVAPTAPEHEGLVFVGWDKDITNVTEDINVIAQYMKIGDVNGDNLVNTGDAVAILRYVVGLQTIEGNNFIAADTNGDGNVNTGDAVQILRWSVGLN